MTRHPRRPVANVTRRGLLCALGCALAGCALTGDRSGQPLVPNRFQTRVGPYRIWTNDAIPADDPAIGQLLDLDREVRGQLALRVDPSIEPIDIYILNGRSAFEHFLTFYYPELPTRRAFFLARGDRRVIYTYRGERLIEDLRHEGTHALLHASVADLPLWLDEGLAEYFEVPSEQGGINHEHLARLPGDLAAGWVPDLNRLEGLRDVRQMTPRDYRESWAWVHYLLDGSAPGRAALLGYLADLRAGAAPVRPLSGRILEGGEGLDARMVAHLDGLRNQPVAVAPPVVRPVIVRGQDPGAEAVAPTPPPRRGVFGRMLDALGLGREPGTGRGRAHNPH